MTSPAQWRDLRLYWPPVVLLIVPFAAGVRPVAADVVVLLLVAYAATAVFEEGLWRGVMIGLLRPDRPDMLDDAWWLTALTST